MDMVENGLYSRNNELAIFKNGTFTHLYDENTLHAPNGAEVFLSNPGTSNHLERILEVARNWFRQKEHWRKQAEASKEKYENLGKALLDEANERSWCGEYDDFAREWDLPQRQRDFTVTISMTVTSDNEETIVDIIERRLEFGGHPEMDVQSTDVRVREE